MLLFNEGLPRSGKSYSAMVDRIIPALKDGRAVFAHLDGLNHEKIAEASGVSLERVQSC
jgi:zona occludens toxin